MHESKSTKKGHQSKTSSSAVGVTDAVFGAREVSGSVVSWMRAWHFQVIPPVRSKPPAVSDAITARSVVSFPDLRLIKVSHGDATDTAAAKKQFATLHYSGP